MSNETMTFAEFSDWAKGLFLNGDPDVEVGFYKMKKLQNSYQGMYVKKCGESGPVINLDEMYERYCNGESLISLQRLMRQAVKSNVDKVDCKIPVADYEQMKKRLFIRISNAILNQEVLEHVPHQCVEDLAITYHIKMDSQTEDLMSFMITNELLTIWQIDANQLHKDAIQNGQHLFPPKLIDMTCEDEQPLSLTCNPRIFRCEDGLLAAILTNQSKLNGAATIFYPGVLEKIAKLLQGNLVILPSSIHEVIIMKETMDTDYDDLDDLVSLVNRKIVSKMDLLSQFAYRYDATLKKIERSDSYYRRLAVN